METAGQYCDARYDQLYMKYGDITGPIGQCLHLDSQRIIIVDQSIQQKTQTAPRLASILTVASSRPMDRMEAASSGPYRTMMVRANRNSQWLVGCS